MIHEYHATMAMQEHHRRVREVTQRAHQHPHVRRASWWARLRRRTAGTGPVVVTPPPLPGVRRLVPVPARPAIRVPTHAMVNRVDERRAT